jgi:HAD superfamily hydrolase (TIGR01509 family)
MDCPKAQCFIVFIAIPEWTELRVGRGSRDAYDAAVERELERFAGRPVPEYYAEWRALPRTLNEDVIELVKALRSRYKVALLSNANYRLESALVSVQYCSPVRPADQFRSSRTCQTRPGVYHLTAERLGELTHACIFIDDVSRNVAAATSVGMHGVTFRGYDALASEFRACGIKW